MEVDQEKERPINQNPYQPAAPTPQTQYIITDFPTNANLEVMDEVCDVLDEIGCNMEHFDDEFHRWDQSGRKGSIEFRSGQLSTTVIKMVEKRLRKLLAPQLSIFESTYGLNQRVKAVWDHNTPPWTWKPAVVKDFNGTVYTVVFDAWPEAVFKQQSQIRPIQDGRGAPCDDTSMYRDPDLANAVQAQHQSPEPIDKASTISGFSSMLAGEAIPKHKTVLEEAITLGSSRNFDDPTRWFKPTQKISIPQSEKAIAKCPSGNHPLEEFLTPIPGYNCDMCQMKMLDSGIKMYGCRKCDWDMCINCRPPLGINAKTTIQKTTCPTCKRTMSLVDLYAYLGLTMTSGVLAKCNECCGSLPCSGTTHFYHCTPCQNSYCAGACQTKSIATPHQQALPTLNRGRFGTKGNVAGLQEKGYSRRCLCMESQGPRYTCGAMHMPEATVVVKCQFLNGEGDIREARLNLSQSRSGRPVIWGDDALNSSILGCYRPCRPEHYRYCGKGSMPCGIVKIGATFAAPGQVIFDIDSRCLNETCRYYNRSPERVTLSGEKGDTRIISFGAGSNKPSCCNSPRISLTKCVIYFKKPTTWRTGHRIPVMRGTTQLEVSRV